MKRINGPTGRKWRKTNGEAENARRKKFGHPLHFKG